jgi:hypothetical protein
MSADGVIIQSSAADSTRFEGFVKSRALAVKYSDYYRNSNPPLARIRHLQNQFTTANKSFLEGTLQKAKSDFELMVLDARAADWEKSQRGLIHMAYLRLAQMASNSETRTQYIKDAIAFDSTLLPEKNLIPPPITSEYNKELQEYKKSIAFWDTTSFSKDFDYAIINGQVFDFKKGSKIPIGHGQHRVTLLSDLYSPIHRVLNQDQILALVPAGIPMAQGTCSAPQVETLEPSPNSYSVFFNDDCVASHNNGSWTSTTPFALVPRTEKAEVHAIETDLPRPSTINWWAVGAIAATVGIIIYAVANSSAEKQQPTPTHE